jgi:hypothetical protein
MASKQGGCQEVLYMSMMWHDAAIQLMTMGRRQHDWIDVTGGNGVNCGRLYISLMENLRSMTSVIQQEAGFALPVGKASTWCTCRWGNYKFQWGTDSRKQGIRSMTPVIERIGVCP